MVRSSALGTFFPADKLPARAKERAWKRVSEEAGPPTHPFSLPPFLASAPVRLFPSFPLPQPKRSPYESKIFSHPNPLPSSRDPRFLLTGEEGESGAHSAVQTSAWGAASLKRAREGDGLPASLSRLRQLEGSSNKACKHGFSSECAKWNYSAYDVVFSKI